MDYLRNELERKISFACEEGSFHVLNVLRENMVCIWGAGDRFEVLYNRYIVPFRIDVKYLIDLDLKKNGHFYHGIKCISPEELLKLSDAVVIPAVYSGEADIIEYCSKNNIRWIHRSQLLLDLQDVEDSQHQSREWFLAEKQKIIDVYSLFSDEESREIYTRVVINRIAHAYDKMIYSDIFGKYGKGEYFSPYKLYKLGTNETYLDVGAYDGDTIIRFTKACNGTFEHIYAMELDKDNYGMLLNNTRSLFDSSKLTTYNFGAWKEDCDVLVGGEGQVVSIGKSNSYSDNSILRRVDLKRIDSLDLFGVTLIKMDIEGAEMAALEGARSVIKTFSPKLAICIYHNASDFWSVPLLIHEMKPDYKIAVRHHSNGHGGTVCYAY